MNAKTDLTTDEMVRRTLRSCVHAAATARKDLAAAFGADNVSQLWAQASNLEAVEVGRLASEALDRLEDSDDLAADLERLARRLTDRLVDGWDEGSSTSQLSNALASCTVNATRRFRERVVSLAVFAAAN